MVNCRVPLIRRRQHLSVVSYLTSAQFSKGHINNGSSCRKSGENVYGFVFPTASSLAKFIVSNSKAHIYKTSAILIYVVYMKV
jgi:hypothetical protein